jgi:hypothetical protein
VSSLRFGRFAAKIAALAAARLAALHKLGRDGVSLDRHSRDFGGQCLLQAQVLLDHLGSLYLLLTDLGQVSVAI